MKYEGAKEEKTVEHDGISGEIALTASQRNKERDYWLKKLSGDLVKSTFPYDHTGTGDRERRMETFTFCFSGSTFSQLMKISNRSHTRLHMVLTAAVFTLVHKYSGNRDIILGTPVLKQDSDEEFINTVLALRLFLSGKMSFKDIILGVRDTLREAYEFQNYPIKVLAHKLGLTISGEGFPLLDIVVLLENIHDKKYIGHINPNMIFFFRGSGRQIDGEVEYNARWYRKSFVERMVQHLENLLVNALSRVDISLEDIEVMSEAERKQLLQDFNDTKTGYRENITIHDLVSEQAGRTPDRTALVFRDQSLTYRELESRCNGLANFLYPGKSLYPGQPVGVLFERSQEMIVGILGVLKAGGAYVPLNPAFPEERIKEIIDDADLGMVLGQKKHIRLLNRLQWECRGFHTFVCLDSTDIYGEEESEKNDLMDKKLWEYVGETAVDEITGGGWLTSYTGRLFTREEMDEFGNNVLEKLKPLLHPGMKVLEIGCASGLGMYRIAPYVKMYYGTDMSDVIIRRNRERVRAEGRQNIRLQCLPAHEIDDLGETGFDLVIMNSVIHCFHGHNYLRRVLRKVTGLLAEKGFIFIGDVLDQGRKQDLIREMVDFKRSIPEEEYIKNNYKTKTDWSNELFVSPSFFRDMLIEIPHFRDFDCSRKIHTIENELTKYRFDVLITVDKTREQSKPPGEKSKYQYDSRVLRDCSSQREFSPKESDRPAYVIYTSGSTGKPKGVMVEHRSVVNRLNWMQRFCPIGSSDILLQKTPISFDVSVWELFWWGIQGASLCLLEPQEERNIAAVVDAVDKFNVSVIHFVPSAFAVFLDCLEAGYKRQIPRCRTLEQVFCSGEALKAGAVNRFNRLLYKHNGTRLANLYGPTEATVDVTYYDCTSREKVESVPIGRPIDNTCLLVLGPRSTLQPPGVWGELFIGGDGVARGYLNRPELTAEKFDHDLLDFRDYQDAKKKENYQKFLRGSRGQFFQKEPPGRRRQKLYKTGDLARWQPDGNLEFGGRMDRQVKIRGFRIELEEIEKRLISHEDVREAVVMDREDKYGDNQLWAYVVLVRYSSPGSGGLLKVEELREYLSGQLPEYMVPAHFVPLAEIPLTSNGKVDRKTLSGYEAPAAGEVLQLPGTDIERKLAEVWADILGIEPQSIGVDGNFFEMGGHSLKATLLIARLHKELNVQVPLWEIFRRPTIRELGGYIEEMGAGAVIFTAIEPVEEKEYYVLSSVQKRLYFLMQVNPDNISYNQPQTVLLEGDLDMEKPGETFKALIRRHEILRTSFLLINGEPYQRVHPGVDFRVACFEADEARAADIVENFMKPFDLHKAPLFRVGLIRINRARCLLIIDMHHIVTDGTSFGILTGEFMKLYEGKAPPPLRIQYKDYSQWQNSKGEKEKRKQQEVFWLEQLQGELPVLDFPTDFPRPETKCIEGESIFQRMDGRLVEKIKQLETETGATLFILLLSAFYVLLWRYSGQEDILVGTPVAGRRHQDLGPLMGMFVNTLVLRNFPAAGMSFEDFLEEVKERTLGAFENQDYPFDLLVEKVMKKRDKSRNPLFDVMFSVGNMDHAKIEISSLKLGPYHFENKTAKFDIILDAREFAGTIQVWVEYSTKLFKRETMERFIRNYLRLLEIAADNRHIKIGNIDLVDEREKEFILSKIRKDKENLRIEFSL